MTGTVYTVPPIPPDAKDTTWVGAGAISIGVEYRILDDAELAANYEGEQMEEIQDALAGARGPGYGGAGKAAFRREAKENIGQQDHVAFHQDVLLQADRGLGREFCLAHHGVGGRGIG